MVYGVGVDIIEINRVARASRNPRFYEKCFTDGEAAEVMQKGPQTAAGFFAAKEAVAKALGTGFSGFTLRDVEIICNADGKPGVVLHNGAEKFAESAGITGIHVSISHSKDNAVAFAVCEMG